MASLYLALAYLRPKRHLMTVMNIMAVICIMLGVMVLVVVISVMNGFDEAWTENILKFQPHVTIYDPTQQMEEDDPLFEMLLQRDDIRGASPFIQTPILSQSEYTMEQSMIRGINPMKDPLYLDLIDDKDKTLVRGVFELDEMECIIGSDLAEILGVNVGDTVSAVSLAAFRGDGEIMLPEDLDVVGIFKVGMYQIDSGFILTDMQTARDVLGMDRGIHGIQVFTNDMMIAERVSTEISHLVRYRYRVRSWKDLNRQLFDALKMEKSVMVFLLMLISVVSSIMVTSTLIMMSIQKTREVGLLKSIGFRNATIMLTFMVYGVVQGIVGTLSGIGVGLIVIAYRSNILNGLSAVVGHEVLPKELYFLDAIPAEVVPKEIMNMALLVIILCVIAGSIPAGLAAIKKPVDALRHD